MQGFRKNRKNGAEGGICKCLPFLPYVAARRFCLGLHCSQDEMQSVARKTKKKQVKDEMDRLKQAEKKKRRLEKALATSAAIRSELEKKKQRKKEEQQRLDEEGAAIAEAVALRVLLGEDSDESEFNFNKTWDCAGNIGRIGYVGARGSSGCDWGNGDWSMTGFSAGLVAAQAVSALHIGDEVSVDTIVLKGRA